MFIVFISILFDNIISLLINKSSIFFPLFTLLSIIFLNSKNIKEHYYFLLCGITGFLYDMVFANNIFMNTGIFLFISLIIYLVFKRINYNLLSIIITSLFLIVIYRIITYFLYLLYSNISFDLIIMFKGVYSSIIINIIYIFIMYFINNKMNICSKFNK